jgi:hypothetical protein
MWVDPVIPLIEVNVVKHKTKLDKLLKKSINLAYQYQLPN